MIRSLDRRPPFVFYDLAADDGGPVWQKTLAGLTKLSDGQLAATADLAKFNLFCALGLKGAEGLDPEACYRKFTRWADVIAERTAQVLPKYRATPENYEYSLPKFKMQCFVSILRRVLGVSYHMPFSEGAYDARDSRPMFIHGMLGGYGGACASLPMLYVALGRRLGYPLFLVRAKEYFFVRWDGDGERFNIEATSPEFCPRDDAHYHQMPRPLSESEIRSGYYLRNLTRREELAASLVERSRCLFDNLRFQEAATAGYFANAAAQGDGAALGCWLVASILARAMDDAVRRAVRASHSCICLRGLPFRKPTDEWEAAALPSARKHLDRVIEMLPNDFVFVGRKPNMEAQNVHNRNAI